MKVARTIKGCVEDQREGQRGIEGIVTEVTQSLITGSQFPYKTEEYEVGI